MDEELLPSQATTHFTYHMDGGSVFPLPGDEELPTRAQSAVPAPVRYIGYVLLFVLTIPFAGLCMAVFGFHFRGNAEELFNKSDGWLLMFIGALFQLSMIIPMINVLLPDSNLNVEESHADFYGPWGFYSLAGFFFALIGALFFIFRWADLRQLRREVLKEENVRMRNNVIGAWDIREELKSETQSNSLFILLVTFVIALGETAFIRSCAIHDHDSGCGDGHWFVFEGRSSQFVWLTSIFWFVLFFSTHAVVIYSLMGHYQQMREVEEFTLQGESRTTFKKKTKHSRLLKDLNEPRYLATWAAVWELLVQDIKYKPATRALVGVSFSFCVMAQFVCWGYIAIRNVYVQRGSAAEFTSACVVLIIFSSVMIMGFIRNVLRLESAIRAHEQRISQVQSDVQMQIDRARMHDTGSIGMLFSKVRVLEALDVYLRVTDSHPKLMGASLETMRWAVIIVGLFLLNAFFIALSQDKKICTLTKGT